MNSEPVTSRTLRSVLDRYPTRYRSDSFALFPTGRGFSGAVICRVETDAGSLCLREWPSLSYPQERIHGLHSLLAHVFRVGVTQLPVPVETICGDTMIEEDGRFWQLEPWMPGIADFADDPSEIKLKSAMQCLASFHAAARTFQPTDEQRRWFFVKESGKSAAVKERLQFLVSLGDYRCAQESFLSDGTLPKELVELLPQIVCSFRRMYSEVENSLTLCSKEQFNLQPCLKDIWHDHVLFTGDEVTGLIDASACRSDSIASDLARLLGSFCGSDRQRWDVALGEYEKQRRLSTQEKILVEVFDRSGVLLSGMNWVEKFRNEECDPDDLSRIAVRVKSIVERLQSFG